MLKMISDILNYVLMLISKPATNLLAYIPNCVVDPDSAIESMPKLISSHLKAFNVDVSAEAEAVLTSKIQEALSKRDYALFLLLITAIVPFNQPKDISQILEASAKLNRCDDLNLKPEFDVIHSDTQNTSGTPEETAKAYNLSENSHWEPKPQRKSS